MTANSLTNVAKWVRRWPKPNVQIRNVIPLFAVALLAVSLAFSLRDLYNNTGRPLQPTMPPLLRMFLRTFLEMSLALLLSILPFLIAAVLKGIRSVWLESILHKTLLSKSNLLLILLFLLLLAPLGPIGIWLVREDPLPPKHVAEYIREVLVSVMWTVPLFVTPSLLAWLTTDRSTNYINTASKQKLESLAGVGPTLAQRIIRHRPFRKVEDLRKVPGIGDKLADQIRDEVKSR